MPIVKTVLGKGYDVLLCTKDVGRVLLPVDDDGLRAAADGEMRRSRSS